LTPRSAKLPLQRLHPLDRFVEMLLEKFFQNVHTIKIRSLAITKVT